MRRLPRTLTAAASEADGREYNCIVLLGPTAVGKTAIGVRLALEFGGEILSADSRQTYVGLDIGSGKDLDEYTVGGVRIPYHLIDVADLSGEYTVFDYQQDFYRAFSDVTARGALPVVVGGTGMYLDAVIRGYDFVAVPENQALRARLSSLTLEELAARLIRLKPNLHNRSDLADRDRAIRAIEIAEFMRSGEAPRARAAMAARPDIRPLVIGTTFARELLRENIAARLRARLDGGMIEEVRSLHERGVPWRRLERLGLEYRYCALFLEGEIRSRSELFDRLNIAIRQFAKRQETWFRGMESKGVRIRWLPPVQDRQVRTEAAVGLAGRYFTR